MQSDQRFSWYDALSLIYGGEIGHADGRPFFPHCLYCKSSHQHGTRNREKRKQRSSLLSGGRILAIECRTSHLAARMIWRNFFKRTSILVWSPDDHSFFWSINCSKRPFFYSSFSSNLLGAKSLVQHGIEWNPPFKQQRQPLPSFLSVSYYMATRILVPIVLVHLATCILVSMVMIILVTCIPGVYTSSHLYLNIHSVDLPSPCILVSIVLINLVT